MFEKIERIIKLLKPKYYDGLTYFIVTIGGSLLTKPIWVDILNSILATYNPNYKPIQLNAVGPVWDSLIGLSLIAGALYWNTKNRLIDLQYHPETQPAYLSINNLKLQSFEELCRNIYPLLNDNEYIFKTVGPNSGFLTTEELRTDLTMWNRYKQETIIPNNAKIKALLAANQSIIPSKNLEIIRKQILHIDAFEEHCQNPNFDYSQHRFPLEFKNIIEETCYNSAISSEVFMKRKKWLNKKFKKAGVTEWQIIGSCLFTPSTSSDMDIVLLLPNESTKLRESIRDIKFDFKLKFKISLHETAFAQNEIEAFQNFLSKNNFKYIGNG